MKTIKEQYKEIVCGWNEQRTENVANRCTEIADDYAIEFAKWCFNVVSSGKHKGIDTTKELLEIFKKEKGL